MNDENTNDASWLNKNLGVIGAGVIIIGVICIVAAPYIFTQFSIAYNLTDKGVIGDAIGGTTAPIASLVGSVLVFLSLYAQIQANRLVLNEFDNERKRYKTEEDQKTSDKKAQQQDEMFKTLLNLVQTQNSELMNIKYSSGMGPSLIGVEAITVILNQRQNKHVPHFWLIENILSSLNDAVQIAEQFNLDSHYRQIIGSQISFIITKLRISIEGFAFTPSSPIKEFIELLEETERKVEHLQNV